MLAAKEAAATIAVKNIDRAKQFYEGILGLTSVDAEEPGALVYQTGQARLLVYESQYAGTNKATAATWGVGDDLEGEVQALKAKGIAFEHYEMPNTTRKGDVHIMGETKVAWFKDPDGNILAMVNR